MDEDEQKNRDPPFLICFLTEFLGTAILMWMGCIGCIDSFGMGPVVSAFSFGLAVTAAIQTFSAICPVHINPAVSLGVMILGKMKPLYFLVYILAQYTGGIVGYASLWGVMPSTSVKVCVLRVHPFMTIGQAFAVEVLAAIILMFAIAGATHVTMETFIDSISIRLGLIVTGLIFATGPFTGAGLNPARGLPPALLYNFWDHFWMFQITPYIGMALAAVIYRFVFDGEEKYSLHTLLKRRCPWCIF